MSKDMKTLDEIRRTVEYCQNPDVSEDTIDSKAIVEKCATLLSHISDLEAERDAERLRRIHAETRFEEMRVQHLEISKRIAFLEKAFPILQCLIDEDPCWFDHHGGCQAHGFLSLSPGEICPQEAAKQLIAEYLRTQGGEVMKTYEEMHDYLKDWVKSRPSQKQAAEDLGVTPQYLSDILQCRRDLSETVVNRLGFKREVYFRRFDLGVKP